jgi:hypothetical protein
MGVWGDGVFDGDGALDFVGHVIKRLADVVDEGLRLTKSKRDTPPFRSALLAKGFVLTLHDPVVPAVALLHAIVSKIPGAEVCLEKRRVREWKRSYFAWYEKEFVAVCGPEQKYRRNVQKEFDGLLRKLKVEVLDT